jgi:hypothetical protein
VVRAAGWGRIEFRKAAEKRQVARSRAMWDDNIKKHLKEVGMEDVDGINLA